METMAERFRYAREQAGLSKAQLARELRISQQAVGQIEKGITKSLRGSTVLALERVTGYSGRWVETGRGSKLSKVGKMPQDETEQLEIMYEQLRRLPPELRAKIEAEIQFLTRLTEQG